MAKKLLELTDPDVNAGMGEADHDRDNKSRKRKSKASGHADHHDVHGSKALGVRMHQWHGGMGDPLYGVGSVFYAGGSVSPDRLEQAIDSLSRVRTSSPKQAAEKAKLLRDMKRLLTSPSGGACCDDCKDGKECCDDKDKKMKNKSSGRLFARPPEPTAKRYYPVINAYGQEIIVGSNSGSDGREIAIIGRPFSAKGDPEWFQTVQAAKASVYKRLKANGDPKPSRALFLFVTHVDPAGHNMSARARQASSGAASPGMKTAGYAMAGIGAAVLGVAAFAHYRTPRTA